MDSVFSTYKLCSLGHGSKCPHVRIKQRVGPAARWVLNKMFFLFSLSFLTSCPQKAFSLKDEELRAWRSKMTCPQSLHQLVQGWVANPGLRLHTCTVVLQEVVFWGSPLPIIKILHTLSPTNSCKGDSIANPLGPTW